MTTASPKVLFQEKSKSPQKKATLQSLHVYPTDTDTDTGGDSNSNSNGTKPTQRLNFPTTRMPLASKYSSFFKFHQTPENPVLLSVDPLFPESTTFPTFIQDLSQQLDYLSSHKNLSFLMIGKEPLLFGDALGKAMNIPSIIYDSGIDIESQIRPNSSIILVVWILNETTFNTLLLLNSLLITNKSSITKILIFASTLSEIQKRHLISIRIPTLLIFPGYPFSDSSNSLILESPRSNRKVPSIGLLPSNLSTISSFSSSEYSGVSTDAYLSTTTSAASLVCPIFQNDSYIPPEQDYRTIIFAHPAMDPIADSICSKEPLIFRKGLILWKSFPDGWPNISFQHPSTLAERDIVVLCDFFNVSAVFEQISILIALPRNFPHSMTIVTPYFSPATMDRVDRPGQLATAETLSTMLSTCIPITSSGPAPLIVYDIHTLGNRFYFKDNVRPRLVSAIPLLKKMLVDQRAQLGGQIAVCFPDSGAAKRFSKFFHNWRIIICTKTRHGDGRKVSIKEYLNFENGNDLDKYHIVIIDDLVQTGGTLYQCMNACIAAGAKRISCYVTHAVFPNESYKAFLKGGDRFGLENFWITNTCPAISTILDGKPPFKVIDISNHLARLVKNLIGRPFLRQCFTSRMNIESESVE